LHFDESECGDYDDNAFKKGEELSLMDDYISELSYREIENDDEQLSERNALMLSLLQDLSDALYIDLRVL